MFKRLLITSSLLLTIISAESKSLNAPVAKFDLKTINSESIKVKGTKKGLDITDAKGKVVFIELWGTHCPPCIFSIPHYIELKNRYKDKIKIYAIEAQGTSTDRLKEFVKEKGINYTILNQQENLNFVRYFSSRSGWRGAIPYLVVLDTNGDVVDIKRGMVSKEYVEGITEYLLKKSANPTLDNNKTKVKTEDNNKS